MAKLPIYNCFHPVLRKKTEEVKEIDQEIKDLVDNMFESMYHADGIGLAANQVGVSKSIVIIDTNAHDEPIKEPPVVMINPIILAHSEDEVDYQEGCLSVPKFFEKVVRPVQIELKYYDLNMKEHHVEASELMSRVMQHEIDHLNGKLFFEKLTPIRRTLSKNKLKKIQRGHTLPEYDMVDKNGRLIRFRVEL
jgi:peptide deformylase